MQVPPQIEETIAVSKIKTVLTLKQKQQIICNVDIKKNISKQFYGKMFKGKFTKQQNYKVSEIIVKAPLDIVSVNEAELDGVFSDLQFKLKDY